MKTTVAKLKGALSVILASALLSACGGGGESAGGEPRFDYPASIASSFGDGGYRVFSTGLPERAHLGSFNVTSFTVDQAGRIIITGNRTSATREAWILRLRPDGTPDTTCGTNGWFSWSTGGPANPYKIRVMQDGRYAVGGTLGTASIWMLRSDCSIDTSWGTAGKAAMPAPRSTEINGALNDFDINSDGSIVATVANTVSGRLLIAKFLPDGSVDTTFGTSGYASVAPPDNGAPEPGALRIKSDGSIIVAASFIYSSQVGHLPGFVQFTPDGQLDSAFGDGGFQIQNPGANLVGRPKDMVILSDGSAVQTGLTQPGVLTGTVIEVDAYWMKVSSSGQPDQAFGTNGIRIWTAGPNGRTRSTNYATSIVVDRSGNLATCQNWTNNTEEASSKVQAAPLQVLVQSRAIDGTLKTNFGLNGTASLPRANGYAETCVGLTKGIDGGLIALLDYGPAGSAVGTTMAIVRVAE